MAFVEVQALTSVVTGLHPLIDLVSPWLTDGLVLAQQFEEPDILGQIQQAFNNFIESGQVWAFLIGLVIGYIFRGMSSFG
ncbi:MAG: hypothetical protein RH949_15380 [Coleofasciculus sp. A1-SPW-01]|uniref:hypothetical protein n=1 Tax=Coleofasciculus TaxID=669368 RepID=UPI0018DE1B5D|nr:hypothetical protein [Coleofasciculus chthonoplastes]